MEGVSETLRCPDCCSRVTRFARADDDPDGWWWCLNLACQKRLPLNYFDKHSRK
jgi:hypothetical protein